LKIVVSFLTQKKKKKGKKGKGRLGMCIKEKEKKGEKKGVCGSWGNGTSAAQGYATLRFPGSPARECKASERERPN
jgi:hypothetical protein